MTEKTNHIMTLANKAAEHISKATHECDRMKKELDKVEQERDQLKEQLRVAQLRLRDNGL